jgi:hypothetical protein
MSALPAIDRRCGSDSAYIPTGERAMGRTFARFLSQEPIHWKRRSAGIHHMYKRSDSAPLYALIILFSGAAALLGLL